MSGGHVPQFRAEKVQKVSRQQPFADVRSGVLRLQIGLLPQQDRSEVCAVFAQSWGSLESDQNFHGPEFGDFVVEFSGDVPAKASQASPFDGRAGKLELNIVVFLVAFLW